MGQKVHPKGLRLGIIYNWSSRWFFSNKKTYRESVYEDAKIRKQLLERVFSILIISSVLLLMEKLN